MKSETISKNIKPLARWLIASAVPLAYLELMRAMSKASFSFAGILTRWAMIGGILLAAQIGQVQYKSKVRWFWSWASLAIPIGAIAVASIYTLTQTTWSAYLTLAGWYAFLLILVQGWWSMTISINRRGPRLFARGIGIAVTAAAGGLIPVLIKQIETRFSDEEFFAIVSTIALALFTSLLTVAHIFLFSRPQPTKKRWGLDLDTRWGLVVLLLLTLIGGRATVKAYQSSFYPPTAPTFDGISADAPFLCGETTSEDTPQLDGETIFKRLITLVEANPNHNAPDLGMLAVATGKTEWAEAFRSALLAEASDNRFAEPAHSVKSTQYEASLRLYYLWKVQDVFPQLFTPSEQSTLRDWFAAINKRALTIEGVDLMYALAFNKWPAGPYENQENGAGLLALLELSGYADPELSPKNRDYLERYQRGWQERYRNNDDAYIYQLEWLNNAYFQWLYTGTCSERNRQLSFEWLLLQSLPDGAILQYNHPGKVSTAATAYLGAWLLNDPHLLWLANQNAAALEEQQHYLRAQPGMEVPIQSLIAEPPPQSSCLLFSNSGLPNQLGPLAPDKIIFRDGWSADATYAMVNLRFSGWHRYKATNTVTALYQAGPLLEERTIGESFSWLPRGRSLFRDKRIPRENLNGLLIERTGMSAVLYELTGTGGPWAQDPPYYAEVIAFEIGNEFDMSHTRINDWRGWQHDRWVYFYHQNGPIIILDQASGPANSQSAIGWHFTDLEAVEGQRLELQTGDQAAKVLFVPLDPDKALFPITQDNEASNLDIQWKSAKGQIQLATVFLFGEWVGAETEWEENNNSLWLSKDDNYIELILNGLKNTR